MKAVKTLKMALVLFIIYFLICGAVVPLIHKNDGDGIEAEEPGLFEAFSGDGTERALAIDDNEEALVWRIRAIESAQKEIILTTFDMNEGRSAREIMAALLEASQRGVKIKIIVDGINGNLKLKNSDYFKALISSENVEAKFYNPVNVFKMWKLNYRMHDKYLVADDRCFILGGRNTNNLFLGNYREEYNLDRDVLVYETQPGRENSLKQVCRYFYKVWELDDCKKVLCRKETEGVREASAKLGEVYKNLKSKYPQAFGFNSWEEQTLETDKIRLISNSVNAGAKAPDLWETLNMVMASGRDIQIQTPYIVCNKKMYGDLENLTESGKSITILTNAVANGANPLGCVDYLNHKDRILNTGVRIYEFLGGQSLHGKAVLVDDNISVIGSFNLDMRSVYLDTETMLVIESRKLNDQIQKSFDGYERYCAEYSKDRETSFGPEYEERSLGTGTSLVYAVLRVLSIPFRHLL